jgi:hypothetical protein
MSILLHRPHVTGMGSARKHAAALDALLDRMEQVKRLTNPWLRVWTGWRKLISCHQSVAAALSSEPVQQPRHT